MKKIFCLLLFLFCRFINISAQEKRSLPADDGFRAINWRLEDGLQGDDFNFVVKDIKGFLWIGHVHGVVSRFDGFRFQNFIPDLLKENAMHFSDINVIREDSSHNIWIGSAGGLARYDIKADTFSNFATPGDSVNFDLSVVPLCTTQTDVYCLEAGIRVVSYDTRSLKKKFIFKLTEPMPVAAETIFDAASNSLWTIDGGVDRSGGGLVQIPLNTGKRQNYSWPCDRKIARHNHFTEGMRYDRTRKCIWMNSPDGLMKFSLADKQFELQEPFVELIKSKDYRPFVGIDLDKDGKVWLFVYPLGIVIYDPESRQLKKLFTDTLLQKKTGFAGWQIYCDRDGIVWTTYWDNRGIYELLPYAPSVRRYTGNSLKGEILGDFQINSILASSQGQVLIGTQNGMNILDTYTNTITKFRAEDFSGISGKSINPLYVDTVNQKAIVLADSVFQMDLVTRKCRKVIFKDGNKQVAISQFGGITPFVDKKSMLIYDADHGFFELPVDSPVAQLVIPFTGFIGRQVMAEDSILYLKTPYQGSNSVFSLRNGKWTKVKHQFDSFDVRYLHYNKVDKTYWVSLADGLVHFDAHFQKIKSYSEQDGFEGSAFYMQTDKKGNIWYANDRKQIGRVNVSTGLINILSDADGYHPEYYGWFTPGTIDAGGDIYLSGDNLLSEEGFLYRISPGKYTSPDKSSVYFTKFDINHSPFLFNTGINDLQTISLRYDQNNITIETGVIDYYTKGKSHMRYKLEGNKKDTGWQSGSAYSIIRYEGLAPGNYTLVLQAANGNNEFNGPEKILSVQISPPFWTTWWFILLSVIAGIIVLYSFIQYRSRNLIKQNVQLEQKVTLRTKELNKSLEELKEAQAQLIHSEKMASLGELTAGIAHEIQNPLNFVNNFSEVNKELIAEIKEEIHAGNTDDALLLANNIDENQSKILHHGKRADAIVKGMLQHSRTSTGQKELTDLNALAEEYLRLAYHGLRAKDKSFNAVLQTDFDQQVGSIQVIPQDIGRVLLNLYNNAFYAIDEKSKILSGSHTSKAHFEPTISVSTKRTGEFVEIKVRDNGNGIPQKVVEKIFQPFFTTKPTGQGTGLGLSLSYDIIKAHAGEITVNTRESEFTEFIIRLPAAG